jgi:hypothetical protein
VWGPEYRDEVAYLRLWVGQLRRKLGIGAWEEGAIRTIQGLGYAFDPAELLPRMRSRRPRELRGSELTEASGTTQFAEPVESRGPAPVDHADGPETATTAETPVRGKPFRARSLAGVART